MSNDPIAFIDLQAQRARIGSRMDDAIANVLAHGAFIMGPETKQLEADLSAFCGAKHAITCSNGTDAIALALMAMKIRPGDAILVPSFTFASTAEVVAWMGAAPIFIDCDPRTFNIDPEGIKQGLVTAKEKGLTPRAIIAVDLFGLPADYNAIEAIAAENELTLICDSAQGFGGHYHGRVTGTIGHITTTSFFPAKPLGCYGDGGAVMTDNDEVNEVIRSLKVHGKGTDKYDNVRIGMNARLDTLQAAILIEKLAIYADEIKARNKVADAYGRALEGVVQTPFVPEGLTSVWAQYTLILDDKDDRGAFQAAMKAKNIPTAVYYPKPLHQQTAYARYPVANGQLPVSEALSQKVVSLPMHPYLQDDHIARITDAVKASLA